MAGRTSRSAGVQLLWAARLRGPEARVGDMIFGGKLRNGWWRANEAEHNPQRQKTKPPQQIELKFFSGGEHASVWKKEFAKSIQREMQLLGAGLRRASRG